MTVVGVVTNLKSSFPSITIHIKKQPDSMRIIIIVIIIMIIVIMTVEGVVTNLKSSFPSITIHRKKQPDSRCMRIIIIIIMVVAGNYYYYYYYSLTYLATPTYWQFKKTKKQFNDNKFLLDYK